MPSLGTAVVALTLAALFSFQVYLLYVMARALVELYSREDDSAN